MEKKNNIQLIAGTPPTGTAAPFQKFWNMASISGDEAEITMYGDICDSQPISWWTGEAVPGLFITPEGFLEDLAAVKDKSRITVKLNSCGGDLYTGIAIHNTLKGLKGHKTIVVEGIAASAASVIMCAGDEVQVYPGSMVMIHGVAGLFFDYMSIADLKQAMKGFEAAEKAIAEIYSAKTGDDVEHLRSMMTKETWMVGKEAVEKGFADKLLADAGPSMVMSADKKVLLVAGVQHNVENFSNIPGSIPTSKRIPAAVNAAANKKTRQGGNKMRNKNSKTKNDDEQDKDIEELEQEIEDLEEEIEDLKEEIEELKEKLGEDAEAKNSILTAERQRLREIEDIAPVVGNDKLVRDAMYDNPCTAQELALRAMKEQSKLGAAYLANSKADYNDSGAGAVGAAPNGGKESNDDAAELNAVVNAYKKSKNGGRKNEKKT